MARDRFVLPTSFAWFHLGLGEVDEAFAWMEQAVDHNDEWVHPLKTYPFLDPIREDPRFLALLRKLSLEPGAEADQQRGVPSKELPPHPHEVTPLQGEQEGHGGDWPG